MCCPTFQLVAALTGSFSEAQIWFLGSLCGKGGNSLACKAVKIRVTESLRLENASKIIKSSTARVYSAIPGTKVMVSVVALAS